MIIHTRNLSIVSLMIILSLPRAACGLLSMEDVRKEYELAHYEKVVSLGKEVLSLTPLESGSEVEVRTLMAFSYVALHLNYDAEREFERILVLNPDFELNPVFTSPKILSVFESVKEKMRLLGSGKISAFDNRKAALWSALFPGLGQIYKGEKKTGYAIAACEVLLLTATIYSHMNYASAHDEYLRSVESEEIEANYETYNDWYRARLMFGGAAIAVWVYSHLDAALRTRIPKNKRLRDLSISISSNADQVSIGVSVSLPKM
ncbi:hypothetical protein E3J62_01165 [candidate division TA06 bacterium]|uniref:DUF5683 domain-containing protein n=1 Tax=candidate division TA06 bacterium TaxID=2250710 RepID=A0A523UYD7_UNCT6|nr:MAG: hypothetical protein E3J62_01165 [candidate division TA06 bacterium]